MSWWNRKRTTDPFEPNIVMSGEYIQAMSDKELLEAVADLMHRGNQYEWHTGRLLTVELQRRTFVELVSREG